MMLPSSSLRVPCFFLMNAPLLYHLHAAPKLLSVFFGVCDLQDDGDDAAKFFKSESALVLALLFLLQLAPSPELTECLFGICDLQDDGDDAAKFFKSERRGGNYGAGTKEVQAKNYVSRKEAERKRRELFDDALERFNKNDVEVRQVMIVHAKVPQGPHSKLLQKQRGGTRYR